MRPVFRFEGLRLNVCAAVILLVDDDPSVRKSLWRLLSVHGYDVHEVSDHTAALEAARGRHPDIMILDLHMPSLSGFEIAREVRADPSLRAICLIAFSASLPDWDEDLNLFDRLVQKPASAELLLDAIADAMGQEARDQSLRSC